MKADRLLLHLNWFGGSGLEPVQNETTSQGGLATFDPDQWLSRCVVRWPEHRPYHCKRIISAHGGRRLAERQDSHFVVGMGKRKGAANVHRSEEDPTSIPRDSLENGWIGVGTHVEAVQDEDGKLGQQVEEGKQGFTWYCRNGSCYFIS